MTQYLVNSTPRAIEYDFNGHTKIVPAQSRAETPIDEAQVALSRFQLYGLSLETDAE